MSFRGFLLGVTLACVINWLMIVSFPVFKKFEKEELKDNVGISDIPNYPLEANYAGETFFYVDELGNIFLEGECIGYSVKLRDLLKGKYKIIRGEFNFDR